MVRAAICEAARQLILEHGFEGTTVDAIARAAGMSRRTFFRYFNAKEDVVLWELDQFGLAAARLVADQPESLDPLSALAESLITAAEFFNDQPEETLQLLRMADATPSLRTPNLAQQERWTADFAAALRARYTFPVDSSRPEIIAAVALSTMAIAVRRWLQDPRSSMSDTARAHFKDLRAILGPSG